MRRGAALIAVTALLAGCEGGGKTPSEPSDARRGSERAVRGVVAQAREARERGTEVPDAVFDRVLAARRSFALRRYDIGVYGPLR